MGAVLDSRPDFLHAQAPRPPRMTADLGHWAVAGIIFVSVTCPVVTLSGALPWFRVEQLALLPITCVYLWLLLAGSARPVRFNGLFLIGLIYSGCILLSLFWGTVVLGHTFLLRDLYEIPKALLPVVFFTLGLEADLSEAALRRVLRFFSAGLVPVCLYAWAQWIGLGISFWLAQFYSGGWHDEGSLAHYRRVYSTMGNPNLLGQLLTWAIAALALALLLHLGSRLQNWLLVVACLVTMAMTGSRYGLIDTTLALVLTLFLSISTIHRRWSLLALFAFLLAIFAGTTLMVARSNRATLDRIESLGNPLESDSLRGRLDELWPDADQKFFQSPLFGHGPAKSIFWNVITDSEYLDVLQKFGLIGFFAYLAYYVYAFRFLWRGLKYGRRCSADSELLLPGTFWALRLSLVMVVTALVMNIGMSTFYNEPLQGFFWLWLGMGASAARRLAALQSARFAMNMDLRERFGQFSTGLTPGLGPGLHYSKLSTS